MNTKQEDEVLSSMGDILRPQEPPVFLAPKTDTAIPRLITRNELRDGYKALVGEEPKGFNKLLIEIDKTDVDHQTNTYCQLIVVEGQTAVDQLRHRADMMRRRADEFDEMADKFQSAVDKIIKDTGSVSDTHQAILNLLSEHAHIKPTRT